MLDNFSIYIVLLGGTFLFVTLFFRKDEFFKRIEIEEYLKKATIKKTYDSFQIDYLGNNYIVQKNSLTFNGKPIKFKNKIHFNQLYHKAFIFYLEQNPKIQ